MTTQSITICASHGSVKSAAQSILPGAFKRTINYVRNHSMVMNALYEGAYRIKRNLEEKAEENGGAEVVRGNRAADAWETSIRGTIALMKRWKTELAEKAIPFDIVIIDQPYSTGRHVSQEEN